MANHSHGCHVCKLRIQELLTMLYGKVTLDYELALPAKLDEYRVFPFYPALSEIHEALQRFCGFAGFVMADKLPAVDFFVHNPGFIVELEDEQHFTLARAITLAYYPNELALGFLKARWVQLARSVNHTDNERPYRNEQVAWYDTLHDFSSAILDFKPTVRLPAFEQSWCTLDAGKEKDLEAFCKIVEFA